MTPGLLSNSMIQRLRRVVGSRQRSHLECRRCGTTIEADDATCPACGSGNIAQYDF